MASGAPKGTAFIGPTNVDGNLIFPQDLMALSIPAEVAERMAVDVEQSFVVRRPDMAYPDKTDPQVAQAMDRLKYLF